MVSRGLHLNRAGEICGEKQQGTLSLKSVTEQSLIVRGGVFTGQKTLNNLRKGDERCSAALSENNR